MPSKSEAISTAKPDALLRLPRVLEIIDVGPTTWWKWHREGKAPKAIKISPRITCWRKSEVLDFAEKLAASGLK